MGEQELIGLILDGDEGAKERLYRNLYKRMVPIAVKMLGAQDPEIEDVVQETFIIAFQKLSGFERRSSLYTWIAHICIHRCYKRLDRRQRQILPLEEDFNRHIASLSMQRQKELDHEAAKSTMLDEVKQALPNLGGVCRTIIELRDFEGKSYADIGRLLSIPIGTVMSRLFKCRENLKRIVLKSAEGKP